MSSEIDADMTRNPDDYNSSGEYDAFRIVKESEILSRAGRYRPPHKLGGWRSDFADVGYIIQDELTRHHFRSDEPFFDFNGEVRVGWHRCSCDGWEGYWSQFEPHVADCIRLKVVLWIEKAIAGLEEAMQKAKTR